MVANPRAPDRELLHRYLPRIRAICPDLHIRSTWINPEGLINDVVVVNDELVFRFAKDEDGVEMLASECRILEQIRARITVPVPEPFFTGHDALAYRLLPGAPLRREELQCLEPAQQQEVAGQIAGFLVELHRTPTDSSMSPARSPNTRAAWEHLRAQIETDVYPHLMAVQRAWAADLFDRHLGDPALFEYRPRLVHGDLGFFHLLFDGEPPRLAGVIDFGAAGRGDPAIDLAPLMQAYGEPFVCSMSVVYPDLTSYMPRARFYAEAIELWWAARAVTTRDPRWFVSHLGGARALGVVASPRQPSD